jgi:hypothetical protein
LRYVWRSLILNRYTIVDLAELSRLCGFAEVARFQGAHRHWVEQALTGNALARDDRWSQAIAIGGKSFVDDVQAALGIEAKHRQVGGAEGTFTLREPERDYEAISGGESGLLRQDNTLPWKQ